MSGMSGTFDDFCVIMFLSYSKVLFMKLLFKNTTLYTNQMYETFLQFHESIFGTSYYISSGFITLILLVFIAMLFYEGYFLQGFLFVLVLLLFLGWRFVYPSLQLKKEKHKIKQKEKKPKTSGTTFYFYENYFCSVENQNQSKISYWKLYRVYETNEVFYLYYSKDYTFLVNKSGYSIGDASTFSQFISQKAKKRFKKISSF